jgi:murein DD-endopeptidase MepM/ murein hydrolase activator NlpD
MLKDLVQKQAVVSASVIRLAPEKAIPLDLSKSNQNLSSIDLNDEASFSSFIFDQLKEDEVGYGGYAEERSLYSRSDLFEGEEPRSIHLGIDLWSAAGTAVYAPLEGTIHSFDNRAFHGDYGPVIILAHRLENEVFYSLYGHLSTESLQGLEKGRVIKAGQQIATMGHYAENFHWPPHLHFQLILDMQGHEGDYPGVCKASEKEAYLQNCPDPSFLIFDNK